MASTDTHEHRHGSSVPDRAASARLHAPGRRPAHRGARCGARLRAAGHLPDERRVVQPPHRRPHRRHAARADGRRLAGERVHRLLRAGQVLDDLLAAVRHGLRRDAGARRAGRPRLHEGVPAPHPRAGRVRRRALHLRVGRRHPLQLRGRGAGVAHRAVRQGVAHRHRLRRAGRPGARSASASAPARGRRARRRRHARAVPARREAARLARHLDARVLLHPAAGRCGAVHRRGGAVAASRRTHRAAGAAP